MFPRFLTLLLSMLLVSILMIGCGQKTTGGSQYSGFLNDYSEVQYEKDASGEKVLRFVSPSLKSQGYNKVLIEPIQYYPEPVASKDVTAETLDQIIAYVDEALRREVGSKVAIVNQPGDGVVRMRVALTAVGADAEGLKPHQFIPVALVLSGARAAAGAHPYQATLFLEAELTDSIKGERMAIAIRGGKGERLQKIRKSGSTVTLESVKPMLDDWAEAYAKFLAETFR